MDTLFRSLISNGITPSSYAICTAAAFACGILTALAASYRTNVTKSFITSLILLPPIVETVILMVNGNVGTGVAVMGAFSLVRFRSVPGKARDMVTIFLAMTTGLACAAGYAVLALMLTVTVSLAIVILAHIPFAEDKQYELRVTVPETLNYTDAFTEVFEKHTRSQRLITTKTCNMGSLYKLIYRIEFKDSANIQKFIDDLRCRNGNLEISVSALCERNEEL